MASSSSIRTTVHESLPCKSATTEGRPSIKQLPLIENPKHHPFPLLISPKTNLYILTTTTRHRQRTHRSRARSSPSPHHCRTLTNPLLPLNKHNRSLPPTTPRTEFLPPDSRRIRAHRNQRTIKSDRPLALRDPRLGPSPLFPGIPLIFNKSPPKSIHNLNLPPPPANKPAPPKLLREKRLAGLELAD